MSWPATWWEPTGVVNSTLRVACPCGRVQLVELWPRTITDPEQDDQLDWDRQTWPRSCPACGRIFDFDHADLPTRSSTTSRQYRNTATGEVARTSRELPPGALYDAYWWHGIRKGPDGRSLVCVLPNGHHWHIDSRASNCGRPDDDEHRCWVRHGEPPAIHVDKNGNTCPAGAGSIQSGDWHGFLHHGVLHV